MYGIEVGPLRWRHGLCVGIGVVVGEVGLLGSSHGLGAPWVLVGKKGVVLGERVARPIPMEEVKGGWVPACARAAGDGLGRSGWGSLAVPCLPTAG